MSQILYSLDALRLEDTQAPGEYISSNESVLKNAEGLLKRASTHQVTIVPDTSATGVVKIIVIGYGVPFSTDNTEFISDGLGADIELDLADGVQTVTFDAAISVIGFIVTTTIAEGCTFYVAGW